jgi:hypothetical protein
MIFSMTAAAGRARRAAPARSNAITAGHFCYRRPVPTTRADGSSPAATRDEQDALTTRTALSSLAAAGVAVALPALARPEATRYYLTQGVALLTVAALLAVLRHKPMTLAVLAEALHRVLEGTPRERSGAGTPP